MVRPTGWLIKNLKYMIKGILILPSKITVFCVKQLKGTFNVDVVVFAYLFPIQRILCSLAISPCFVSQPK